MLKSEIAESDLGVSNMETLNRLKIFGIGTIGLVVLITLITVATPTFWLVDQYFLFIYAMCGVFTFVLFGATVGERYHGRKKTGFLDFATYPALSFLLFGFDMAREEKLILVPIFAAAFVAGFLLVKIDSARKYITEPRVIANVPIAPE